MDTKDGDIQYTKSAVGELNSKGEFVGVASTPSVDREGDIVVQEGWDLSNFKDGGPLLWSHNPEIPAPGRILWAKVDGDGEEAKLLYKAQFHRKNQFSKELYELVKAGYIKSVSVGFRAIESESVDKSDTFGGRKFTKQELMEISLVNVPALPQATITAVKAMNLKSDIIRKAFNLEEEVVEENSHSEKSEYDIISDRLDTIQAVLECLEQKDKEKEKREVMTPVADSPLETDLRKERIRRAVRALVERGITNGENA